MNLRLLVSAHITLGGLNKETTQGKDITSIDSLDVSMSIFKLYLAY